MNTGDRHQVRTPSSTSVAPAPSQTGLTFDLLGSNESSAPALVAFVAEHGAVAAVGRFLGGEAV